MCGRYTLKETKKHLAGYYHAEAESMNEVEPSFNVTPAAVMPVVGSFSGATRSIRKFRWGLLPAWAKEKKTNYTMINARSETVDHKKSYKDNFRHNRCIVPANGFYEWQREANGPKTPYYVYPVHEKLFSFAGIYNVWQSPDGKETIPTYLIITCEANQKMQQIHNRMPVMLLEEEWDSWLDSNQTDAEFLQKLLDPFPDDALELYRVSREVNNARNNSPDLIQKAS